MRPLHKLFWDEMAEMLHVKELLLKALPKMSGAAAKEKLKEALGIYRTDVEQHSAKLRSIFQTFEMFAREKKCDGMMGVLLKGQQIMQRTGQGPALDAALHAQCLKITAYNLASYYSLHSWAKLLMKTNDEAVTTLKELVRSETEAVVRFSRLASECHSEAANQQLDSVRPPPRPSRKVGKEARDFAHWGAW
jgi:ferritin-like metal-binding protein YciE